MLRSSEGENVKRVVDFSQKKKKGRVVDELEQDVDASRRFVEKHNGDWC